MNSGTALWLRHNRVHYFFLTSLILSLLVKTATWILLEQNGNTVDIDTVWVSALISIPLLFIFTHEDDFDRVSPRSIKSRRLILLALVTVWAALVGLLCFWGDFSDYGSLTVIRNDIGLIGLGLVSTYVLKKTFIWVLPVFAVLGSLTFSWPLEPSIGHSLWGALRAPCSFVMPGGQPNLSALLIIVMWAVGAVIYVQGWSKRRKDKGSRSLTGFRTGKSYSSLVSKGKLRASYAIPIALILIVFSVVASLSSASSWLGSPQLLMVQGLTVLILFFSPATLCASVISSQSRWRSGNADWEDTSPRSRIERLVSAFRVSALSTLIPLVILALVLIATSFVGAILSGVSYRVTFRQLLAGTPTFLMIVGFLLVSCVIGTVLGSLFRGVWIAPLCLFLGVVFFISVPVGSSTSVDRAWDEEYGFSSCSTSEKFSIEVCSSAPNSGYLKPMAATLDDIYQETSYRDDLPRKFVLVNSVFDVKHDDVLSVGLQDQRHVVAPRSLDKETIFRDINQSLSYIYLGSASHSGQQANFDTDQVLSAFRPNTVPTDNQVISQIDVMKQRLDNDGQ